MTPVYGARAGDRAADLLDRFGSIAALSAAPPEVLERALDGAGDLAAMFAVSRGIIEAGMRERVARAPVDSADPALLEHLILHFAGLREERLLAIYLDRSHGFVRQAVFATGTIDWVSVRPRALFAPAVALDCGALVIAHNHPSGLSRPSAADVVATRTIAEHGRLLEIELLDHLVVAGGEVFSMRRAGLL